MSWCRFDSCSLRSTADTWLKMQMSYDLAQVRKRPIKVKRLAPV